MYTIKFRETGAGSENRTRASTLARWQATITSYQLLKRLSLISERPIVPGLVLIVEVHYAGLTFIPYEGHELVSLAELDLTDLV